MTANIAQKAVLKHYNKGEFSHLVHEPKTVIDYEIISDPAVASMVNQIDLDPSKCELDAAFGVLELVAEAVALK
jgi:hypothetical protein